MADREGDLVVGAEPGVEAGGEDPVVAVPGDARPARVEQRRDDTVLDQEGGGAEARRERRLERPVPLRRLQRAAARQVREAAGREERVGGEPAGQFRRAEEAEARIEAAGSARARERSGRQLQIDPRRYAVAAVPPRGMRLAGFEQRRLVAQDDIAHGTRGVLDAEGGTALVAEGEMDLVPREQRALVVEGADEAVPALDGAIGVPAPVHGETALDAGGEAREAAAEEPRPGSAIADRDRVGLLVHHLRIDARAVRH